MAVSYAPIPVVRRGLATGEFDPKLPPWAGPHLRLILVPKRPFSRNCRYGYRFGDVPITVDLYGSSGMR
jgi:hypothetical protein